MLYLVTLIIPKLEVTDAFIKYLKDRGGIVGAVFSEESNSYTVRIFSEYDRAYMKVIVSVYYSFAGYSIDIMETSIEFGGPIDIVYITGYDL